MCNSADKSHVEAWKSLIELTKTVISIASAILTALIGYYVVDQPSLSEAKVNYLPPLLLVAAILIAIYGFGRAIRAVKTGSSERFGVLFSNISVILLVAGILSISLVEIDNKKQLSVVLAAIDKETETLKTKLSPNIMQKAELVDSNYLVTYDTGAGVITVTFSEKANRIVKVE